MPAKKIWRLKSIVIVTIVFFPCVYCSSKALDPIWDEQAFRHFVQDDNPYLSDASSVNLKTIPISGAIVAMNKAIYGYNGPFVAEILKRCVFLKVEMLDTNAPIMYVAHGSLAGDDEFAEAMDENRPSNISLEDTEIQRAKMAALLVLGGVHVNSQTSDGITSLMYAAAAGHSRVVKVLLAAGADPNLNTHKGSTPLLYALIGYRIPFDMRKEIVAELLAANAEEKKLDTTLAMYPLGSNEVDWNRARVQLWTDRLLKNINGMIEQLDL